MSRTTLDPHGVIVVRAATQVIEHFRDVAHILGVDDNRVRVIAPYVGGEVLAPIGPAFRAAVEKGKLEISLGYSRPLIYAIPAGIEIVDAPKARAIVTRDYIEHTVPGQSIFNAINLVPGVNYNAGDPYGGKDTLTGSIEGLRGTRNADVLVGDGLNNHFRGLGGSDFIMTCIRTPQDVTKLDDSSEYDIQVADALLRAL